MSKLLKTIFGTDVLKKNLIERKFLTKGYLFLLSKTKGGKSHQVPKLFGIIDRRIAKIQYRLYAPTVAVHQNKVMLFTFKGGYDCNPKSIAEELRRNYPNIELVWVQKSEFFKTREIFPPELKIVRWESFAFYREAASSKIWIQNSIIAGTMGLKKKKNQILIDTWHGSIGLKSFESNQDRHWIALAHSSARQTDFIISNSTFETDLYKRTFWKNATVLETGHPRNDILFLDIDAKNELKKTIYNQYGIDSSYKLLLYGPTFRDNYDDFSAYEIDYASVVNALQKRFGGIWRIGIRFHPRIRNYLKKNPEKYNIPDDVIDFTDHMDISELLAICDAGISDYSSWICDFAETRKPAFILALDLDNYYKERGFTIPLEKTPFSICKTNEQLSNAVLNFNQDEYAEKCNCFFDFHGCIDDGRQSSYVAEHVEKTLYSTQEPLSARYVSKIMGTKKKKETDIRFLVEHGADKAEIELFKILWKQKTRYSDAEQVFIISPLVDRRNADALVLYQRQLSTGRGVSQDLPRAISILSELIQYEPKEAILLLFQLYYDNPQLHIDPDIIYYLWHLAEKTNNPEQMYCLSLAYWKGVAVEPDLPIAIRWANKAYSKSHIAEYRMLEFDILYDIGTEWSKNRLVDTVLTFANKGNVSAIYRLALLHWRGIGTSKNLIEAEKWMRKAAQRNYPGQKYDLYDILYELNTEVFRWELKRKVLNHPETEDKELIIRIARYYRDGKLIEKNLDKAIYYYKKACVLNSKVAISELIECVQQNDSYESEIYDFILNLAKLGNIYAMEQDGIANNRGILRFETDHDQTKYFD